MKLQSPDISSRLPNREDPRWRLVDRIVSSTVFHRAPRLTELLVHLAACSISGHPEETTEVRIAGEVFQRADYRPSENNLVRASVRQLRSKLKEYFDGPGLGEDWLIEVPKGQYAPVFLRRERNVASTGADPKPLPRLAPRWPIVALAAAGVPLGIVLATFVFWIMGASIPPSHRAGRDSLLALLAPGPHQRTQIVVSDAALFLSEKIRNAEVPLDRYADGTYWESAEMPRQVRPYRDLLRKQRSTGLANVYVVSTLLRALPAGVNLGNIQIRFSRDMTTRDFDSEDNFVLIGSPIADPWVRLFDKRLNFQFAVDSQVFARLTNAHPAAGEVAEYPGENAGLTAGKQYCRLAVLHTGHHGGRVVLIGGTRMEATEAGGSFFAAPDSAAKVLNLFHARRLADLPDFELLLETDCPGGAAWETRVAAYRTLPAADVRPR